MLEQKRKNRELKGLIIKEGNKSGGIR